jgi:ATP/maltotriose-dependent transcriptional regulator MalT
VAIPSRLAGQVLEEFRRLSRLAPREREGIEELSTRELEVLKLAASGNTDKEIAIALSLSIHTIKTHMRSILAKLQVSGRKEAARTARDKGLMS